MNKADALAELSRLLQYDPPYEWRGGNLQLLNAQDSEVIVAGGAETGKTVASCYKAHMLCREYPGAQGALVRKTAASIPGTVLLTMKRIIGKFPVNFFGGDHSPERIIYPNGSQIWIGGMDNPTKVLSGERDFIQVCQAEELTLDDWEIMTTRTTGRGAVMPFSMIYGDCNPAGSKHWIRDRSKAGHIKLLSAIHKDNPSLYTTDGQITEQGKRTMERLAALTGVRRKRLLEGIWATAEGAVFDMFDASVHVKTQPLVNYKNFRLAMDEGYTNPAVILVIGEDNDGRRHVFHEFYETGKLQSVVVAEALKLAKEWGTRRGSCDEAASGLIAELRDAGLDVRPGKGRILNRIKSIQDDLAVQRDGRPRLTFDPSCENTINDFESYIWKPEKDEPVKKNDHAPDALGYDYDAEMKAGGGFSYV